MLSRAERIVALAILLAGAAVTLYPVVVLLATALEPTVHGGSGITFFHALSFSSFATAWTQGDFGQYMLSTALVTLGVVTITVTASTLAGFGIAILQLPGSRLVLYCGFLAFMLPVETLIVPWHFQFKSFGLLNSYWSMILPQAAQWTGFGIFWMYTSFRSIPRVFLEAAALDGASGWRSLLSVCLPSVAPALKTMSALVFLWTWNSFLLPLVMESNPTRFVLSIGLSAFQGNHFTNYSLLAAGSIITAIPVVIVYLISQRSFLRGMFGGAIVG